jgi:hypothetical protein
MGTNGCPQAPLSCLVQSESGRPRPGCAVARVAVAPAAVSSGPLSSGHARMLAGTIQVTAADAIAAGACARPGGHQLMII